METGLWMCTVAVSGAKMLSALNPVKVAEGDTVAVTVIINLHQYLMAMMEISDILCFSLQSIDLLVPNGPRFCSR